MDLIPAQADGRRGIEAYGGGGFRISGQRADGSILVLPDRAIAWPVTRMADLTLASLAPVEEIAAQLEILVLGCGPSIAFVPRDVRTAVRAWGPVIEALDTGAACRTYNVLLSEGRRAAAALIAV